MNIHRHILNRFALLLAGVFSFTGAIAQVSHQTLDGNNIKARFSADGQLFWDGKNAHFEAPKGSGKNTISAASLWIGGLDAKGDLHLSAQTYRETGSDFWPGPLDENGAITEVVSQQYNRVWKITKLQVDSLRMGLGVPQIIMDWPQAAPYIDADKNGKYEPLKGDYPEVKGDEMVWWVFNDNLKAHTETGGTPFGIEVQASAFTFNCSGDEILKNTVFINYKITNRSQNAYDSVYAGIWADFDIGNLFDDYVGSDSALNTFYAYNADNFDNDTVINSKSGNYEYKGFGKALPIQSLTYLKGLTGKDGREMNMSKFIYFNNEIAPTGNPKLPIQYYNLLRGQWLEKKTLTHGGNGYDGSNTKANYAFPGNISNADEWTEVSAKNRSGDRRGLGTFGPVTLNPGQTQELTAAFLFTQSSSGITARTAEIMKKQVGTLIQNYKQNLLQPCTALKSCETGNNCVWPGDANNDGKASASDIFNIGYGFGETGPARSMVSVAWEPQSAPQWQKDFPNGVNYRYADADGNGKIDSADVLPLFLNLGQSHGKGENAEQTTNADPVLRFNFLEDSAEAGTVITGELLLGSDDLPADNIMGVAGTLVFDQGLVEPGSTIAILTDSELGRSEELLLIEKYDFITGRLIFGLTRKDKSGKKVKGILIRWKLVIDPNVAGNKKQHAKMEEVVVVNSDMKPVTVNTQGDEIVTKNTSSSIGKQYKNLSGDINLYPNPAQNNITINLPQTEWAQLRIVNLQGQEIMRTSQEQSTDNLTIPVSHFPQGIYIVEIQTAEGRAIKKFSKVR